MKIIKALPEGIAIHRHSKTQFQPGTLKGIYMPNDTLQSTYNSYLEAYNDIAVTERERLLRLSVSDDIVSINPKGESQGIIGLMEHIEQFQKQQPGASLRATSFSRTMAGFYRSGRCTARTEQRSQPHTATVASTSKAKSATSSASSKLPPKKRRNEIVLVRTGTFLGNGMLMIAGEV